MKILNEINEPTDIKKLSYEDLNVLADEIRSFIIENVSMNGGHLASNLGTVDLTIALLKVFDFNYDKIVFDVGHQAYTYKILTKRFKKFKELRKYKGLSGFPKRGESKFDFFDTGHSSNSISAALGLARARDLDNENYNVIALIGDGAMAGGEAFEGMNDLGNANTNMLIILNDNGESISTSVGGLAKTLNKIRINPKYLNFKEDIKTKFHSKNTIYLLKKLKNRFKKVILPTQTFETLGLKYFGPIDGHNIKEVTETLNKIKVIDGPIVLHVITKKGKGYLPAMMFPNIYHGVSKFDPEKIIEKNNNDYSTDFGQYLIKEAEENQKVVAICAAMKDGTGLTEFAKKYENRFFDVGLAEEHAVTLAAGLACANYRPVVAIYSTFLERAYDQILIDVCMQDLPVVFAIDRAGLVGNDGETHQGVFDISYLSHMPNIEILAPKNTSELKMMLHYAINNNHPTAIRYPKGTSNLTFASIPKIKKGQWEIIQKGQKIALIATGKMVEVAVQLGKEFPNIEIINACFIKPLDEKLLKQLSNENFQIITIEDNQVIGGLGNNILLYLNQINCACNIRILGYSDKFIKQGSIDELLTENNMNFTKISEIIKGYLNL